MSDRVREELYQHLNVTTDAGMSLVESLSLLVDQGVAPARAMLDTVKAGRPLSDAIEDPFERAVLKAMEQTGRMDRAFADLHALLEQRREQANQFRSGMLYPLVVLHAVILIPPVLVFFHSGPLAYAASVIPPLAILHGVVFLFRAKPELLRFIPIVGGHRANQARVRFLRSVAMLWEAGIPVEQSLDLAAGGCGDPRIAGAVRRVSKPGMPVLQVLSASGLFTPMVLGAAEVGEISGALGKSLNKAAEIIDNESRHRMGIMMKLLPLVAILGLGVVTALILITFYSNRYG